MTESDLFLPGSICILHSLGDDRQVARRLAQMGILPGSRLRIVRAAPLGGTLEVASDQGELFALRREEMAGLDCRLVAAPLTSPAIRPGQTCTVLSLEGGRAFRQRMTEKSLRPGSRIRIGEPGTHGLLVSDAATGATIALGRGEAARIIVGLTPGGTPE
ncbi:MAG TPA: hypothetical protein ENI96_06130 [Sedimenticola thiotaurini]|uniref:Ferrous iron transporter FeoA-like domain-containing protein n=1 Tax=Sedimenticola thiotaurini TaxID=1543721 RepID=A0A831RJY1_9GAMM|nr:hypothetical protein [Sedimenticola thiotaurini]